MGQLSLQAALATRDPHAAARVTKYKLLTRALQPSLRENQL